MTKLKRRQQAEEDGSSYDTSYQAYKKYKERVSATLETVGRVAHAIQESPEAMKYLEWRNFMLGAHHSTRAAEQEEKPGNRGTQYQTLLAIHYLLKYTQVDSHNTKKARFASFLTGYSEHTFRQTLVDIHQKSDTRGDAWEKDMQTVRSYFEGLGLSEVVKLIDNDLASQEKL